MTHIGILAWACLSLILSDVRCDLNCVGNSLASNYSEFLILLTQNAVPQRNL